MGCTASREVTGVDISEGIHQLPEAEEVGMDAMLASNNNVEYSDHQEDVAEEEVSVSGSNGTRVTKDSQQMNHSPLKDIAMYDTARALDQLTELLGPNNNLVTQVWLGDQSIHRLRDNRHDVQTCEMCQQPPLLEDGAKESPLKVSKNSNSKIGIREAINQAIEATSCPICLEVYICPVTLPCGHSICLCHRKNIHNNRCPVCRQSFPKTRVANKNFALARRIRSIVTLACLADPQEYYSTSPRSPIRDAATRVGLTKNDIEEYLLQSVRADKKEECVESSPRSVSNDQLQSWWVEGIDGQPKEISSGINDMVVMNLPDC